MRVICLLAFIICSHFIGACQNEKNPEIKLPPRINTNSNFINKEDSLEFVSLMSKVTTSINSNDTLISALKHILLKSIDETRTIHASNFKIYTILESLMTLDKDAAKQICFAHFDVQLNLDRAGEDVLKPFPFIRFISKKVAPYEFIDALILSPHYNKCFEERETMRLTRILQMGIGESFATTFNPIDYAYSKDIISTYVDFRIGMPSTEQKYCLIQNLKILRTEIINRANK